MSLIDALLLEAPLIQIWISIRSDTTEGSGTQQDPYNGSTLANFDRIMRDKVKPNTCVHLGPGTFQTAGYYEGISTTGTGWQMQAGVWLVGSGIDVTVLKRVNDVATGKLSYAIGHDLAVSTPTAAAVLVDYAHVSDLTIDINFDQIKNTASVGAGGIRLMGNHARASRVKIKNWGNKHSTQPVFGIAMLTANTNSGNAASNITGVANCGIDSCIAVSPDTASTTTVVALHVGAKENPGDTEGFGLSPYLRNCYVDGGGVSNSGRIGLGMSWCKGGLIEGNTVTNIQFGGPLAGTPNDLLQRALSLIIRGNAYRDVVTPITRTLPENNDVADSITIEGNQFELDPGSTTGIRIEYTGFIFGGAGMFIHENSFRKRDGAEVANAIAVIGAASLSVVENVIENGSATSPISFQDVYNSPMFLENRTGAGKLVQGRNPANGRLASELATDADDALLIALLSRA